MTNLVKPPPDRRDRDAETFANAKARLVEGAERTRATIRERPYQLLAIALGVGVLLGLWTGRRPQKE